MKLKQEGKQLLVEEREQGQSIRTKETISKQKVDSLASSLFPLITTESFAIPSKTTSASLLSNGASDLIELMSHQRIYSRSSNSLDLPLSMKRYNVNNIDGNNNIGIHGDENVTQSSRESDDNNECCNIEVFFDNHNQHNEPDDVIITNLHTKNDSICENDDNFSDHDDHRIVIELDEDDHDTTKLEHQQQLNLQQQHHHYHHQQKHHQQSTNKQPFTVNSTCKHTKSSRDTNLNGSKNYHYDDNLRAFVYNMRQRRQALKLTQERAAQSFRAYTNNNLPYSDHIISYIETFAIAPDKVRELIPHLSAWITYTENQVSSGHALKFCASQKSMQNLNNNYLSPVASLTSSLSSSAFNTNNKIYSGLNGFINSKLRADCNENIQKFEDNKINLDLQTKLPEVALASTIVGMDANNSELLSSRIQAQNLSILSKLMLQATLLNNVQSNLNKTAVSGPTSPINNDHQTSPYSTGQTFNNNSNNKKNADYNPMVNSLSSMTNDNSTIPADIKMIADEYKTAVKKISSNNQNNTNVNQQQLPNSPIYQSSSAQPCGSLDLSKKITKIEIDLNGHKNSILQSSFMTDRCSYRVSPRLSPNHLTNDNYNHHHKQHFADQNGALNLSVNHRSSFSSSSATGSSTSSISNTSRARSGSNSSLDTGDTEDLDKIRAFIEDFKSRRGALGLTQKQAAQCFRSYTNDRFAFSDNFVGHFEGFQFRPQTAMTIADSLSEWLEYAEKETREGRQLTFMQGRVKETRKRKYEVIRIRDSAKKILVEAFEENRSPSTSDLESLSNQTGIPTRNIEIWFKNRRTSTQYRTY